MCGRKLSSVIATLGSCRLFVMGAGFLWTQVVVSGLVRDGRCFLLEFWD